MDKLKGLEVERAETLKHSEAEKAETTEMLKRSEAEKVEVWIMSESGPGNLLVR